MPGKRKNRSSDGVENPKVAKKRKNSVHHRSHGDTSGVVLTLGQGDVGQLGLGETIQERMRPALVDIPDKVVQVCAGGMHTVCLTNIGEIYSFGCNDEGALGRDTSEEGSETEPGKVDLDAYIIQISAGDSHTAALTDTGMVYAWGNFRDANGSMGLTKQGIIKTPMLLVPDGIVKIASGSDHLACLTEEGDIYTAGCAEQGQLGRVAECFSSRGGRKGVEHILNPGIVRCKRYKTKKKATFSDIWTGQYITFAQESATGDIYGWGLNNYFQLGLSDMKNRFVPERIDSFSNESRWLKLSGGQHHTVALNTEGKVYTLGRSEYGRLGLGEKAEEVSKPTVVPVLVGEKCQDIAAGGCVSFAINQQGKIYSWGMGTNKQLGLGTEDDAFVPENMSGKQLENRVGVMVSSGGQHTVVLATDK